MTIKQTKERMMSDKTARKNPKMRFPFDIPTFLEKMGLTTKDLAEVFHVLETSVKYWIKKGGFYSPVHYQWCVVMEQLFDLFEDWDIDPIRDDVSMRKQMFNIIREEGLIGLFDVFIQSLPLVEQSLPLVEAEDDNDDEEA